MFVHPRHRFKWLLLSCASAIVVDGAGEVEASVVQGPTITVVVLDSTTAAPLENADVTEAVSGQHRFTNERGEARLLLPRESRLRLRVRQIGFRSIEREVDNSRIGPAGIQFRLSRVSYILPAVVAKASTSCEVSTDHASLRLSALVLEQLRASAERFDAYRRAYPFRAQVTRRTAKLNRVEKTLRIEESKGEVESSKWSEPYRPGRLIKPTGVGFSVPILYLSTLGDPLFWEHHCFTARGAESLEGGRVIRLDFLPAPAVRTVDWAGSALVDSSTSVLRKVEFRLTGLKKGDVPRKLEGYTTFRSPSPMIAIPDSTVAGWWRRDETAEKSAIPDVAQLLHVTSLRYRNLPERK